MKQFRVIALMWCFTVISADAADEVFSKSVRAEDFSAAGLGKLSPEELARLDALVRDYRAGAMTADAGLADKLVAARREADAAAAARVTAEANAARAEAEMKAAKAEVKQAVAARAEAVAKEKKSEGSLLARAKVLLTPGTEIEYATVETRIKGDFKGWEGRTVLTLENGQRWQIANGGIYTTPPVPSPKVKIFPATMGGFWMTIEGVSMRVKVVPFGAK